MKSMTGVGRAEAVLEPWHSHIVVDVRSVNHKFLELVPRLPPQLAGFEGEIRDLVRQRVRRGYVQLTVTLDESAEAPGLVLDHRLLRDYLRVCRELKTRCHLSGELDVNTVLAYPGIVCARKADENHVRLWRACRRVIVQALEAMLAMKRAEGGALVRDLRQRLTRIRRAIAAIERRVPTRLRERRENLLAQLREMKVDSDPKRILEEVAFISEKVDIHEECVRLKSHGTMFLRALSSSQTSGKKLDFIAQEMLRETDTMAAKARDMVISRRTIEIKGEIEKLKEQVRNVE
ncbi:YicC family protein [candidate division WOR-3 bacterium]|nr:YicC family protein [candidate division WOR-3 bacterium]